MKLSIIFTLIIFFLGLAKAEAQIIDSSFYEWSVFELDGDEVGKKECYIVSHPKKTFTNHNSRKIPYFMITRYQHERNEEVSIYGGFEYKKNGRIFVFIDGKQYKLYPKGEIAWAQFRSDDVEIIQKLIISGTIRVKSDSTLGTYASDEYSTKGIARAYARMKDICK